MHYYQAETLEQALDNLKEGVSVLAGGTDFYPDRVGHPISGPVLDISRIPCLKKIVEHEDYWEIGATATWSDIIEAPLDARFEGLKLAAKEIGGIQIQNQGTLGGNICNASPAADGVPPLLTLDAEVVLQSIRGTRNLPLQQFILGNRKTAIAPDELVTAIRIPRNTYPTTLSHFLKIGARKYLLISIAMVAITMELENGTIKKAAIAVGSCSEIAKRLFSLEKRLLDRSTQEDWPELVFEEDIAELSPIDDIRSDSNYRRHAAVVLLKRVLQIAKEKV